VDGGGGAAAACSLAVAASGTSSSADGVDGGVRPALGARGSFMVAGCPGRGRSQ